MCDISHIYHIHLYIPWSITHIYIFMYIFYVDNSCIYFTTVRTYKCYTMPKCYTLPMCMYRNTVHMYLSVLRSGMYVGTISHIYHIHIYIPWSITHIYTYRKLSHIYIHLGCLRLVGYVIYVWYSVYIHTWYCVYVHLSWYFFMYIFYVDNSCIYFTTVRTYKCYTMPKCYTLPMCMYRNTVHMYLSVHA